MRRALPQGGAVQFAVLSVGLLAVGAALYFAEDFLAPVCLALVAGVILTPVSDFLDRLGLPRVLGALLCLAGTLALIGLLVLALQPVVERMIDEAPKILADVEASLRGFRQMFRNLDHLKDNVTDAMQMTDGAAVAQSAKDGAAEMPTVTDALLLAPAILGKIVIFAGTLFFFLATREEINGWVLRVLPDRAGQPISADHLRRAERQVSRYFFTITLINLVLAAATTAALKVMGLPGALQWGIVIFFANFVVYLGPAVFGIALIFAGIAAFDGPYTLLPAATFFAFNIIEGQFVTPALVGREMRLNPLLVFLSVTFGLWLWGPIGGIVVIPVLVWGLVLKTDKSVAGDTGAA